MMLVILTSKPTLVLDRKGLPNTIPGKRIVNYLCKSQYNPGKQIPTIYVNPNTSPGKQITTIHVNLNTIPWKQNTTI